MAAKPRNVATATAIILLLAGCGGSGSNTPAATAISGNITAKTYTIPAGATYLATADLNIQATDGIEIDGVLQVPPGVNVSLISTGPVNVKGSIVPAPVTAAIDPPAKAKAKSRAADTNSVTVAGNGSTINSITSPAGTNCIIVAGSPHANITFTSLTTDHGKFSTSKNDPGGDAGSIEIGTANAIAKAAAAGATTPSKPDTVTGQNATGGDGGSGYVDSGTITPASASFAPTNGGNGGSISILANVAVNVGDATAGSGGAGGGISYKATPDNATGTAAPGQSVTGSTGSGGNGGNISLTPAGSGQTSAGTKGLPGDIAVIAQGGGPAGPGGEVNITAGNEGDNGTGAAPFSNPGPVSLNAASGAGGASGDQNHDGGAGGKITILQGSQKVHYSNFTLKLSPGAGGNGFTGGCGSSQHATNGGAGGDIHVLGATYTLGSQADGGTGGTGTSAGKGGAAGIDTDSSAEVGKKGDDGNTCQLPPFALINTYNAGGFVSTMAINPNFAFVTTIGKDSPQTSMQIVPTDGSAATTLTLPGDASKSLTSEANTTPASGSRSLPQNLLYVAIRDKAEIAVIDLTTKTVTGTIPVPGAAAGSPNAVAVDTSNGHLYADTGTGIAVIDTANANANLGTVTTNRKAVALAVNPTNHKVYVSGQGSSVLVSSFLVIDGVGMTVLSNVDTSPSYANDIAANPTTNTVYATVAGNGIWVISGSTNAITSTLPTLPDIGGIAVDPVRNRFYVTSTTFSNGSYPGTLYKFDGTNNSQIAHITVGQNPQGIAVDASADHIYVANQIDNTVSIAGGG